MKKFNLLLLGILCLCGGTAMAQYKTLHAFNGTDGGNGVFSNLTLSGTTLYGVATFGGQFGFGSIFSIDTNGGNFIDLHDFVDSTGHAPGGNLILLGNILYGTALLGGTHDSGCLFSIRTDGSGFKDLFNFAGVIGYQPIGLVLSGSTLYGVTYLGGQLKLGCIYSIDTNGTNYTHLYDFNGTKGSSPVCPLTLLGNILYGTAGMGGAHDSGCIFSIHTDGSRYKDMLDFAGPNGNRPYGGALALSGSTLYGTTSAGGGNHEGCIFSIDTDGTYNVLYDFVGVYGTKPSASVVLSGGLLVGTTSSGGAHDSGCIFSVLTDGGSYRDIYDFNKASGCLPILNSLTVSGEMMYGVVPQGGANDAGVVYSFKYPTLSIANITIGAAQINVYPNPSSGVFTLEANPDSYRDEELRGKSSNVAVYNMLGEKVYSESTTFNSQLSINLSNQPNGIYLYKVISEDGTMAGEGKLVIQK